LGGISSIRGYLENQILRDNSYLASLEFHLPLVVDTEHNSLIALAPFTDFGVGWNNVNVTGPDPFKTRQSGPQTVAMPSVGVGLLVSPIKYVDGQIYWGYGLNRRQVPGGPSLQNEGVEFSLSLNAL
jgi:hemolysin activation/secretion protein